ncbi:MAG: hypothetical protein EBS84_16940 [Proteobacteria bacterium]|nr:hypothetical protein [Verrucomicrobiota bacterium]NBU10680.1 hypothetical protein [Pseudomonadota bacterium]
MYFTDFFEVAPDVLADYGAFNVACIVDLPLFIDPFLLFTSSKPEYQALHLEIIRYLQFLRDKSVEGGMTDGLLEAWFCFPEVVQNRLGFCLTGSNGHGLGMKFARALNENLNHLFADFGSERVTKGSHLEKLVLIRERVGRDNISDFTTNLIKGYLLEYTQAFAKKHINQAKLKKVKVHGTKFNYTVGVWEDGTFELPWLAGDYVLLTPEDILTKDNTWINKEDLRRDFPTIREAIPNASLRGQIDQYFRSVLPKRPTENEKRAATEKTLRKFPELIDYFILDKEEHGDEAVRRSAEKVREVDHRFVENIGLLVQCIADHSAFYTAPTTTLEETGRKIEFFKQVIENQDGYRYFYDKQGKPIERETDLHLLFKLVWEGSPSSVDAEVNNGRGPVDFKVSRGSEDKTLVEFKLASNSQLERNVLNQVAIYEKANQTTQSFKVILFFTAEEEAKTKNVLSRLKVSKEAGIVLIDARRDNKPSASKA